MMAIGYDPWHIDDSLLREFEAAFGKSAMIPIRQWTCAGSCDEQERCIRCAGRRR